MAAADAADVQAERRATAAVLEHQETIRIGLINARHQRLSQQPHAVQRLPLRIAGEDYGRVAARIPKDEFWHFVQQGNFGYEGFLDDGGLEDFLKTRPACRVETISGKTTLGWQSSRRREQTAGGKVGKWESGKRPPSRPPAHPPTRPRFHFAAGTLNLAT